MKSLASIVALFLVMALVAIAYAGSSGGVAPAVGKVNVPLTVPKKSKSACVDIVAGRATSVNVNVANTTMLNWAARHTVTTASAGTAEVLKRSFDTNTAYMPIDHEYNLPIESGITNAKFTRYSGATTIKLCTEQN